MFVAAQQKNTKHNLVYDIHSKPSLSMNINTILASLYYTHINSTFVQNY